MCASKSNDNGRAFEAILVEFLSEKGFHLTDRARKDNTRDSSKVKNLDFDKKKNCRNASKKILEWLLKKFISKESTIDRLPDDSRSVSDISINSKNKKINISLKYNHAALKHPRPYSLAISCGFNENSEENLKHRDDMQIIEENYRLKIGNAIKFNEHPEHKKKFYEQICKVCKNSLVNWSKSNSDISNKFFKFIIGNEDFYKIILKDSLKNKEIIIQEYLNLPEPKNFIATVKGSRLIIKFDNSWIFNLRIHTASSRISKQGSQLSLKFDANRVYGTVKEEIIKLSN